MTAGGAGIPVTVVVKPFHLGPGAFFPENGLVEFFLLFFIEAQGSLNVKSSPANQIPGKNFFGHIRDHSFSDKPGPSLNQAPRPEIFVQLDLSGCLAKGPPQCLQQGIGLRYDVKSDLVELHVPGSSGGPGKEFIVPGPLGSLEIVIPQPFDTRR